MPKTLRFVLNKKTKENALVCLKCNSTDLSIDHVSVIGKVNSQVLNVEIDVDGVYTSEHMSTLKDGTYLYFVCAECGVTHVAWFGQSENRVVQEVLVVEPTIDLVTSFADTLKHFSATQISKLTPP